MGIIQGAKDKVKTWLFGIAIKKVIKRVAVLVTAWLSSQGASQYGFTGGEAEVTLAVYAVLHFIRNFVKTKWPEKFDWL